MTLRDQIKAMERFGASKLARYCEVTPQAVHHWRTKGIPKMTLRFLALNFPDKFWR